MLLRTLIALAALGALAGCKAQGTPSADAPSPSSSSRPLVLEAYPAAAAVGEPGWVLSGGGHDAYSVHRDATATATAWLLEPMADTFGRYGTWMRQVDASTYRGKRVRISGQMKTKGATRRVDFWARVQAADSPGDGPGLGGQVTPLPADSDFEAKSIVLDVPDEAARIEYGVGVAGPGKVWVDAAKIEAVGSDVVVTTGYPGETKVADWLLTGVGAPDYLLVADGDAARVEAKSGSSPRFVAVMHVVPAAEYLGKHIALSFEVRTDGMDRGACVVKAQRTPSLQYSGFLAADMSEVKAPQAAFAPCATGIDVPPDAKWILYGFTYRGAGKAWVRGGRVEAR